MKIALIVINRNLPTLTDSLVDGLIQSSSIDICPFVIESGSDVDKLSKYTYRHINSPEIMKDGLRFYRGTNYAFWELNQDLQINNYDYFIVASNDAILESQSGDFSADLVREFSYSSRIGIVVPCQKSWGEYRLLEKDRRALTWYASSHVFILKKDFVLSLIKDKKSIDNYIFDWRNYRGFCSDIELIGKAYLLNYSTLITRELIADEETSHKIKYEDLVKTDPYDLNIEKYLEEGREWLWEKYGYVTHWHMWEHTRELYKKFIYKNPQSSELIKW